jgi:tricorn protease
MGWRFSAGYFRGELDQHFPFVARTSSSAIWSLAYPKDLNGVDWAYYKKVCERFLPFISDNRDFAEMESELLGELNASHTGCYYMPETESADATAALGAFFDPNFRGDGVRIQEIIEKGPLVTAAAEIRAGMIIGRKPPR